MDIIDSNDLFRAAMDSLAHLGRVLLDDDAHDYGWFEYNNRYGHPDHPSPFHHWWYGAILIFIAECFKKLLEFLDMIGLKIQEIFKRMKFDWSKLLNPKALLDDFFNP